MFDRQHNHEKLKVWKRSHELAVAVTRTVRACRRDKQLPTHAQLMRSIAAIPANIAEGAGHDTPRQFARYIVIALGSIAESRNHLALLLGLGAISDAVHEHWDSELVELTWMLHALRRRLLNPRSR